MGPLIKRSEGSHYYSREGKPRHEADLRTARKETLFPSVTTIDKAVFPSPFLTKWIQDQILLAAGDNPRMPHEGLKDYAQRIYDISQEKSRTASEFGKKIHDACEKYPDEPTQELKPWVEQFAQWYDRKNFGAVERELVLVDHDIGIAGRTDMVGLIPSGWVVVDYKSQDVKTDDKGRKKPAYYDSWTRQLAFYAAAYSKEEGIWPITPTCISLIIDSNPGGLCYEKVWTTEEISAAYRTFVHGAWLWFDERQYFPVGEWTPDLTKPLFQL